MKKYWGIFLVLFLSFFAIRPLFQTGFFPIHDDTQVVRVQQMALALKDGQFPVRWIKDLGYGFGYPLFNFYAPLAYYLGAIFDLVGFGALTATKIMFGLGIILAGLFMYFLAKEFWGKWGGLVAALFYVYAPYHAVDIYVRGAVSELWAIAFLPLVFLGVYRRRVLLAAISLAAVILSHNLTAMMLMPFLFLMLLILFLFQKDKKQFVICNLKFGILAAGLSAFYWLPALAEMNLTKVFSQIGGGADWRDHFVFLDQLWASPWGFGGSALGRLDGMSFMIGKIHLLVALLSLVVLYRAWCRKNRQSVLALSFALFLFLITVFLTNKLSYFIWQLVPPMAFIQYPWRFLIFATLATSFMAGSVVSWRPKNSRWWPAVIEVFFISGLLVLNTKYFQPQTYLDVAAVDYINEKNIKWATSKISDEYLPRDFLVPQTKDEAAWKKIVVTKGEAEIKNQKIKTQRYDFDVAAKEPVEVLVNTAYFPSWQVWVDDERIIPAIESGRIKLAFSPGTYRVVLKFTNTPIRSLANLISLLSLGGLGVFMLKYRYARKRSRGN